MVRFRKKKDEKAEEFQKDVALTEEGRPTTTPLTEDYVASLGRSVYSIIDPEVVNLLNDEELQYLIPALSHLNRMTNIQKEDVVMDRLDLEYIFLRMKCTMDEDDYDHEKANLLESLEFFANHIPTDAFEGFKAKLLSYQMKIIETRLQEKKK